MKRFWRVGILALFCAASAPILLHCVLPVRAQGTLNSYESAVEATNAFIDLLANTDDESTEFNEIDIQLEHWDSISRKDLQKLKPESVDGALKIFAGLLRYKSWKVASQTNSGKTAIVKISPSPASLEVVCIREGNSWRIDLVATYAKRGHIKPLEAEQELQEAPERTRNASCQTRMKQLALAMASYREDHNQHFPPAKNWTNALKTYDSGDEGIFDCPSLKGAKFGYAMNWKLSSASSSSIKEPETMGLFYESTMLKANHSGEGKDMAFRHLNGSNIAFVDGHIRWYKQNPERKWPGVRFTFNTKG